MGYIRFFSEERPMCCLGYMAPKQFREEPIKANLCSLPTDQCLHLPMILDTKKEGVATKIKPDFKLEP